MKSFIILGIILGIFSYSTSGFAELPSLQERWDQEKTKPGSSMLLVTQSDLGKRHILFIPGSWSELDLLNWSFQNFKITLKNDFHTTSETFKPSTRVNYEENFYGKKGLKARVNKIYQSLKDSHSGKTIDIVAHSMGAGLALFGALQDEEFRNQVGKFILIQGPYGGAADGLIFGHGPNFLMAGTKEQAPVASRELFQKLRETFEKSTTPEEKDDLRSRIFEVRAYQDPSKLGFFGSYCNRRLCEEEAMRSASSSSDVGQIENSELGKTDGMITLTAQFLKDIGIVLAPLTGVEHVDLVVAHFGLSKLDQRAFARAVLGFSEEYQLHSHP